jgi:alpha-aminoadipate/glutamate carrier protein LysW
MVLCPECENDLDLDEDELEEGDVVSCTECGTDFEVVTADPLELAPISEDEDEDDDEEEDEEEDE